VTVPDDLRPGVPGDLAPGGRGASFVGDVLGRFELRPDERELLLESGRLLDLADELRALVRRDGLVLDVKNVPSVHPALVELRQVRQLLRLHLRQLDLPDESGETAATKGARRAAQARWAEGKASRAAP
jgi:hypothetical protein